MAKIITQNGKIITQNGKIVNESGGTWVINYYPQVRDLGGSYQIIFTTNGQNGTAISNTDNRLYYELDGSVTLVYTTRSETYWTDEAYRTITFETAPTGGLLTWLQANAVKQ